MRVNPCRENTMDAAKDGGIIRARYFI